MKLFLLTFFLSSLYFEGSLGGVIDTVNQEIDVLLKEARNEFDEMIAPVMEGTKQLQERITEYKLRHSQVELFSMPSIDMNECFELGQTLENSTGVALNISRTVFYLVMNISTSFNELSSNCSSWNVIHAVECYSENIRIIKNEIQSIKPLIQTYEKILLKLASHIENQFFLCIGDEPVTTSAPATKTEPPVTKATEAPVTKATAAPVTKSEATTKSSNGPSVKTTKKPWWHFW